LLHISNILGTNVVFKKNARTQSSQ